MKIYKTQEEFNREVKDGVFRVDGDVTFEFNLDTPANINARNINAWNINAWNIDSVNINAWNIDAWDINAWNIDARDIDARDIDARDINAWNIDSVNINARNINARDINYYAYCIVYDSITCKSYKSRRENALPLTVLDGKVEIKTD